MSLTRVVAGRSATLTHTFESNGTPTDPSPDSATVTITRADGTVFVPAASVDNTGTGTASITLTPTELGSLDRLTVAWTVTIGGYPQTFTDTVEVAGGTVFTVAQARTAIGDSAYDAAKIVEARTYAETELENAVGFALVPRYAFEAKDGSVDPIVLRPYVRAIRSITAGGGALTTSDLAGLTYAGGILRGYWWPRGYGNVLVGYEHGLETPPPGATRAALALALDYLGADDSSIHPRAESVTTVDGTLRLRMGGQFGVAAADDWIAANRMPAFA